MKGSENLKARSLPSPTRPGQTRSSWKPQITLTTLLLVSGALPIWIFFAVEVLESRPFWGFGRNGDPLAAAPIVLCGLTLAIHQFVRVRKNAWAMSMLLAGMVTMAVRSAALWLARNW